jgi:hypothetical protein
MIAAAIPVLLNVAVTFSLGSQSPQLIGVGATVGLMAGFIALIAMAHIGRRQWMKTE